MFEHDVRDAGRGEDGWRHQHERQGGVVAGELEMLEGEGGDDEPTRQMSYWEEVVFRRMIQAEAVRMRRKEAMTEQRRSLR